MTLPPVTRFAPSPTGYLHLGHVVSALHARKTAGPSGRFLMRIEDIDTTRCTPALTEALREDRSSMAWSVVCGTRPSAIAAYGRLCGCSGSPPTARAALSLFLHPVRHCCGGIRATGTGWERPLSGNLPDQSFRYRSLRQWTCAGMAARYAARSERNPRCAVLV